MRCPEEKIPSAFKNIEANCFAFPSLHHLVMWFRIEKNGPKYFVLIFHNLWCFHVHVTRPIDDTESKETTKVLGMCHEATSDFPSFIIRIIEKGKWLNWNYTMNGNLFRCDIVLRYLMVVWDSIHPPVHTISRLSYGKIIIVNATMSLTFNAISI